MRLELSFFAHGRGHGAIPARRACRKPRSQAQFNLPFHWAQTRCDRTHGARGGHARNFNAPRGPAGSSRQPGPDAGVELADLYPSADSPEVEADLTKRRRRGQAIKELYQGKLAELAKDGARLARSHRALRGA